MSDICSLKFQSVALATNSCFLLACWLWLHVLIHICHAFSALTLLVEHQEEHPVCRNWLMRCWCGYLSGVKCRLFACRPCCPTLAWFKSRLFFAFLVPSYSDCPGKEVIMNELDYWIPIRSVFYCTQWHFSTFVPIPEYQCECVDSPLHTRTNFSTILPYHSINLV